MRTLKFKPQRPVYVFRCRQSSKRNSWETEAHLSRVKRSRLSVVIGRFRSILFVSVFQGSLAVAIIMIDGSEKPRALNFRVRMLLKTAISIKALLRITRCRSQYISSCPEKKTRKTTHSYFTIFNGLLFSRFLPDRLIVQVKYQ